MVQERMNICIPGVMLLALGLLTAACDPVDVAGPEEEPADTSDVIVRKPNLYLYPATTTSISVRLGFPQGGAVIASDPAYNGGWTVTVEPSGLIERVHRYLFYEARTPDMYQYSSGWVVEGTRLEPFFRRVMSAAGFSDAEIADFVEYWIPLLPHDRSCIVYPQQRARLDGIIRLGITPQPDVVLRLFFVVHPLEGSPPPLRPPVIDPIVRRGFVAAEWGVVLQ